MAISQVRLEVGDFVVPLLVLLPAAYFIWYVLGAWFLLPVSMLSGSLSQLLFPDVVQGVVQDGLFLLVVVADSGDGASLAGRLEGMAPTAVDAFRVYGPPLGAGIPLFLALAIASNAPFWRHVRNVVVGIVTLLLGQTLSVMLKIIATLFSQVSAFRPSTDLCSSDCFWAILYPVQYFTYLILPTLLAILVWAALYAPYLRLLLPAVGNHLSRDSKKVDYHS